VDRTAELRWFFRRPPPDPVVAWFEAAGAGPAEARGDLYLVLRETDALGIKTRGGTDRLEFKLRPRPAETVALPEGVSGQREEWQRWSFSRSPLCRLLPRLGLPAAGWRAVAKERRTVSVPFRGDAGCRVELTALETDGQNWWTVGFEAYGPDADRVAALTAAAERFFGSLDLDGDLGADLSCGYPGWLATL
jgi:hypothetical protein